MKKIFKFIKEIIFTIIKKVGILSKSSLSLDNVETIDATNKENSLNVVYKNSNTIIKIVNSNSITYFKECRPIVGKNKFIQMLNNDYKFFSGNNSVPLILNKKRFFSMGSLSDKFSPISNFFASKDFNLIGLKAPSNANEDKIFIDYAKFVWSEIYNFKLNSSFKKRKFETFNAGRSLSFYSIAKLFSLSHLVPNTRLCKLVGFGNYDRIGVLMDDAGGSDLSEIDSMARKNKFSYSLQKELLNLNILDAICNEKDHRPDNYHVIFDEDGNAKSICAFDNDSPMSFFISKNVSFKTYEGCSPLVKEGYFNRPFIDIGVYERINNISKNEIINDLSHYLNKCQIKALLTRLNRLKRGIDKSVNMGKCKVLKDEEWNKDTIDKELSGSYGLSYLGLYSSGWVNPNSNLTNE